MDHAYELESLADRLSAAVLSGKPGESGNSRHVRMWLRDRGKCGYCGEDLLLIPGTPYLIIDSVLKNGYDSPNNRKGEN